MEQELYDDDEPKECFGSYEMGNKFCEECTDKETCIKHTEKPMGRIYTDDPEHIEELQEHTIELKHPFHDTTEMFEVYECPNCQSHFFVESEALESLTELCCPYCKTIFK